MVAIRYTCAVNELHVIKNNNNKNNFIVSLKIISQIIINIRLSYHLSTDNCPVLAA